MYRTSTLLDATKCSNKQTSLIGLLWGRPQTY